MVIVHQPLAVAELKRARQDPNHVARRVPKPHGDATEGDQDDATQDVATQRGPLEWFMRALSVAQRPVVLEQIRRAMRGPIPLCDAVGRSVSSPRCLRRTRPES